MQRHAAVVPHKRALALSARVDASSRLRAQQQLCLGEGVGERTVDGILLHKCHVRHQILVEAYHLEPRTPCTSRQEPAQSLPVVELAGVIIIG